VLPSQSSLFWKEALASRNSYYSTRKGEHGILSSYKPTTLTRVTLTCAMHQVEKTPWYLGALVPVRLRVLRQCVLQQRYAPLHFTCRCAASVTDCIDF